MNRFKKELTDVYQMILPELEEGEFYESEIVGSAVLDEEGQNIGVVKEVLFLPANDVWVVSRPNKKDLLLPYIDSVILNVDKEKKEIIVHILEGLDENED